MLDSISWQEFLTTLAILSVAYYLITFLLLYHKEITSIFRQSDSSKAGALDPVRQTDSNQSNSLMGSARYQRDNENIAPREVLSDIDELHVAALTEEEEAVDVVDLLEEQLTVDFISIQTEVNSLVEIASQVSPTETITFFRTLLSNYSQFVGTAFQVRASQFIYDCLKDNSPHHFELTEVNSWWTDAEPISNTDQ